MTAQTRASFYLIEKPRFRKNPLLLVCELARRCLESGKATLILVRDQAQAEALDDLLWSFDEDAFIPHQIAGRDEDDHEVPVLIVPPETETADRPYVINLRDAIVEHACERILEVVPADPQAREPLRERWRQYKARGFDLDKHDL